MDFLRGLLGCLGVGCAYMTGRTAMAVLRGWSRASRLYGWIIRTMVCLAAMIFRRPLDRIDGLIAFMAVAACASAMWQVSRHHETEQPEPTIFPDEP